MKASEIRFEEFLSQTKTNFLIPVYQRNYDWKDEQCLKFLKDIELLATRERDNHFLGSIVYIKSDDLEAIEQGLKEYIIIDGQQRVTTIMLFLKAIYDLNSDEWEREEILENFLINKIRGNNRLKLKPIKDDNEVFEKLLKSSEISEDCNSRIYQNYQLFFKYFEKSTIKLSEYFKAFRRLWIVYIELDRDKDDPQLIFESINSTGLNLSEADLIRNFILMDKKHDIQDYLFEVYWSKIEKLLLSENISSYIRDYLTMKENKIPKQSEVYVAFKNFVSKNSIETEDLLKDLLYYAKIYSSFIFLKYDNQKIKNLLKELKDLKVTVSYPFLLHIFKDYQKNIIDENSLYLSLELIKNYVFRRLVCEYNTNTLNKVFMTLYKELTNIVDFKNNYFESLASILINKSGTSFFPKDNEFMDYFITKDMYKFKNKNYLLYQLESYKNKEKVPFSNLTIEHIMPQKLTAKWNIALGDKFTQVHEKYLHNIGNLTLSGYNSNLSNKTFQDKKIILQESGLKLNRYFENIDVWNREEIEKRAKYLFENIALNIWNFPKIDASKLSTHQKQDFYTLNDNFDVTGTKIKKINILDNIIIVKSWIQCFKEISKILYDLESELFQSFIYDEDFQGRQNRIVSDDVDLIRKPIKIKDNLNLYLESNLSANSILSYIKLIAEKYELEGDDIVFYFN